jgi:hypothetical protein
MLEIKMNTKDQIEEIFHTLIEVEDSFKIWNKLKEHQSMQCSVNKMKKYSDFFLTTIQAHFTLYVIGLYRLFETRNDTVNIPKLKEFLEKGNKLENNKIQELNDLLSTAKNIWIKISILRNEAIGHSAKKFPITEVFQKAKITPLEIENLIDNTIKLMNKITYSLYNESSFLLSKAEIHTDKLIKELKL